VSPVRALAAACAAALLLGGCGTGGSSSAAAPPSPSAEAFHGVEPDPVPERPDFVLRTTSGQRFDFRAETGGEPTLLYFGYTDCPDECPTAMADIAAALRTTPVDLRDRVQVVFVTTDPDRDSAERLRQWLDQFSTTYVGLVGSQAEVDSAQQATGVTPARKGGQVPTLPGRPNEHAHKPGTVAHTHDRPLGYGVAHANVIFAFDTRDRLPVLYPGGVRPADIAADLPLLAQGDAP
jgi:protein SCO1/2